MVRRISVGIWIVLSVVACERAVDTGPITDAVNDSDQTQSAAELEVEVFYRERMMLPPTATLEVVLENSAKMDVAAELVAKAEMPIKTGPPYRVTLRYDPAVLDDKGRYGVRARIMNEKRLMFTSTQFNPAFGQSGAVADVPNSPVEVLVRRTAGTSPSAEPSITGTRWVLRTLGGKPAGVGAGGRAADLTLQGSEPRASGFAGCNQFSGGYTLDGDQLSFGPTAMTMRACTEGMDLERDFSIALRDTKGYRVEEGKLSLLDQEGALLAELAAE